MYNSRKGTPFPLCCFLNTKGWDTPPGISFVDSTPLRVCHNRRIHQHKTFKGVAERGQCSIGWFFCFKLHLIINDKGEITLLLSQQRPMSMTVISKF
ncbi:MAG: transposase [Cyclobacteriaceae bacterium]|nr:transposase [Cyclobacteriaceae bacterium]